MSWLGCLFADSVLFKLVSLALPQAALLRVVAGGVRSNGDIEAHEC